MDKITDKATLERWRTLGAQMSRLIQTPEWDEYVYQLEGLEKDETERMIAGAKTEFDYQKGLIQGLRQAVARPLWIIEQARKVQE